MISASQGLGFSLFSTLKSVVKNPLVRQSAAAAASTYAPTQYAQGVQYAQQAKAILHPQGPGAGPPGPHGHGHEAPMSPTEASDMHPVKSNFMLYGLIGAGVLVALMLTKK